MVIFSPDFVCSFQNELDHVGPSFGEFKNDTESIFERISRSTARGEAGTIRCAVVDHGNPAFMHGAKAATTVACKNDQEIIDGMLQAIPSHYLVFGRFNSLADALGCKFPWRCS